MIKVALIDQLHMKRILEANSWEKSVSAAGHGAKWPGRSPIATVTLLQRITIVFAYARSFKVFSDTR
jgi:hypothetical protein